MPVSAALGIFENPINLDEFEDIQGVSEDPAAVDLGQENQILDGTQYVTGKVVSQRNIEKRRVEFSEQSGKTEDDFALLSDEAGRLSLIDENQADQNSTEYDISTITETEPVTSSFAIVEGRLIVVFGAENDRSITWELLETTSSSDIQRVSFDVSEVYSSLDRHGVLEGVTNTSVEDIDSYTNSAHISGDIKNSEVGDLISGSGKITWSVMKINHKERELTIGVGSNGRIVLYGSVNLPMEVLVEIVLEYSLVEF